MFDIRVIIRNVTSIFSRRDYVIMVALILLFLGTRLINLDSFPIFSDEGIYIRWAKVAWKDASWRFISLTDGRQPLQTWGTIPFLQLFYPNSLLAGRMFSVLTGFFGLVGIASLMWYLWGKRAAFWGALLYIVVPYFLFYDRLALADSGVNAFALWILFFSIMLVKTMRFDIALVFGWFAGFGLLMKSSVKLFLLLSLLAPIMVIRRLSKIEIIRLINYYILLGIVLCIGFLIYNVQRLSPFFHYVSQKNTTFIMTGEEFIAMPFKVFFHNMQIIPKYIVWEMGFIVPFVGLLGLYILIKRGERVGVYLLLWILIAFFTVVFLAKVLFPRYVLFLGSLLIIPAGYYFAQGKFDRVKILILVLTLSSFVLFNYYLLFDPVRLSLPPVDRGQYIEGVTAVWGAEELMEFARKESMRKPVTLLAEGNFGLIADVLDVYLRDGDNIEIKGLWPLNKEDLIEAQPLLKEKQVYVVFSHRTDFPLDWPIEYVTQYNKPNSSSAVYVYSLLAE